MVVTFEVVGTLNTTRWLKNELCALRGGGDVKTFQLSLAPSASTRPRASARARARASTNASIRASASARARVIGLVPRGDEVIGVRGGGLVEASCGG